MSQFFTEEKIYTIDDIARELGISKTTVSRAISGKGRLSDQTRARVLEFIEAHNSRPNAVAKGLAQNRTSNIGLILPGDGGAMGSDFFQECTLGISQAALERDYDILFIWDDGHTTSQIRRIIDNRKVDGLIAARSEVDSPIITLLKDQRLPFVIVGASPDREVLYVDNDNRNACRDLVDMLIARGARRLALLGGSENHCVTHARLQGFEDACARGGLSRKEQVVELGLTSGAQVAEAVERACEAGAECLVCMDSFICDLALLQLRARGVAVPREMKLACMYDSTLMAHTFPPVTSLRFDAVELGRAACHALLELLDGNRPESCILPGYQLFVRDSTG